MVTQGRSGCKGYPTRTDYGLKTLQTEPVENEFLRGDRLDFENLYVRSDTEKDTLGGRKGERKCPQCGLRARLPTGWRRLRKGRPIKEVI